MASIDDLFKGANGSYSTTKRKFEPITNPDQVYKSAKYTPNGDAKGQNHASTEDEPAEDDYDDDDGIAGPELPPDDGEEENAEDEEGRFFGGGVNKNTRDAMDYMDEQDGENMPEAEKIDNAWLRRTALNFEKRISKNGELRAKYEDEPTKFMTSEGDLDADIKALSILTDHPELYGEFARLGCVNSLVSLLAHENTDITINAIEIISELTDEDVSAEQDQWDALANALLEADLPDLLVQNLERLDETNDSDRSGVYHSLSLLEHLASQVTVLDSFLAAAPKTISWLLSRIQSREAPANTITQNTQYSAEILSILLQTSDSARATAVSQNALDRLLTLLSAYRKRDPPPNTDELLYAESLFDSLTCLLASASGKRAFLATEGIELCLLMLGAPSGTCKFGRPRALRVLDHALSPSPSSITKADSQNDYNNNDTSATTETNTHLVTSAGLKPLFHLFAKTKPSDRKSLEHILSVFASLLRYLPGDSAERIRTIAKFVEKDYEKVVRLVGLRKEYGGRLGRVGERFRERLKGMESGTEEREEVEGEVLEARLEAGLFVFQTVDVVLAWLIAEDEGARGKITALLGERDEGLRDVKKTLVEQLEGFEGDEGADIGKAEMLRTLIDFVSE